MSSRAARLQERAAAKSPVTSVLTGFVSDDEDFARAGQLIDADRPEHRVRAVEQRARQGGATVQEAVQAMRAYAEDVRSGAFPNDDESYHLSAEAAETRTEMDLVRLEGELVRAALDPANKLGAPRKEGDLTVLDVGVGEVRPDHLGRTGHEAASSMNERERA